MSINKKLKKFLVAITLLFLTATFIYFRIDALAVYLWREYGAEPLGFKIDTPLNLQNYRVEIDGLAIPDVEDASDLAYNAKRKTLFTVLNQKPFILELSLDGRVLRKIKVNGVTDMEGITHIGENQYVIIDEKANRISLLELNDDATEIDVTNAPHLVLKVESSGNKNYEGIVWDALHKRLLLVKERDPKHLISITGFVKGAFDRHGSVTSIVNTQDSTKIEEIEHAEDSILQLRDLSALTIYTKTGHLLLLSDESRMLIELDKHGRLIGSLALWMGFHGLSNNVPHAEGVAIGADKKVYVISEPNLFYVFSPI
ncbi:SdiA-regulated domain-containing protein [Methylovorus sp. MM2]|uniref:SdiA-regulated domain-containing protein n=1 Tax=Methylovorus sp. MM2 TaxID=1848038 RepID=UPI000AC3ACE8|nr:SdiA-regulated domain-containing protein [Methylovorus sp. MM2]